MELKLELAGAELGNSSSMKYLNESLTCLRGKKHPVLSGVFTTHEVKKSKIHIKMLAGDYLTYEMRANRSGGSPHCKNYETYNNERKETSFCK